jgi:hypothetical protein
MAGGWNFTLLALLTFFLRGTYSERQILVTAMVAASRTWLGGYLLYRVIKRGKDARFDEIREKFWVRRAAAPHHHVAELFGLLGVPDGANRLRHCDVTLQIWVFGCSLPVLFLNGDSAQPELEARDWIGLAMFGAHARGIAATRQSSASSCRWQRTCRRTPSARTRRTTAASATLACGTTRAIRA